MSIKGYRRYVLAILTLVYALNFVDRALISLLLQPIKEDLHLSDSQLGFLTGIAFALFYATLGVPIARWADRGNRATITAIAISLWGLTVMSCLFVTSFVQLTFARVAAAVGESGCMPPTYSLVGDYFPAPATRTRAMSIYMLAAPIAWLVSCIAGGWLNELYGWRVTFFVMGAPALAAGVLVKLTVADPRVSAHPAGASTAQLPRMADVLGTLWRQKSSRNLILALVLLFTLGLGMASWYAAFMMRSHGMQTAELGVWMGLIFGFGGIAGTLLGGYAAARWFAHSERNQMRLSAATIASLAPCFALFLFVPQKRDALIALIPLTVGFNFFLGPTFALMQRLVIDEMRATTLAVVMLLANLLGMGIGPQIVGLLSDLLAPTFGNDSLRWAMLIMSLTALWAAYHFWQAAKTIEEDLFSVTHRNTLSENPSWPVGTDLKAASPK